MFIQQLASWIIVGFAVVWFLIFLILSYYRYQEEKLHKGWEQEAKKIKGQPIAMDFITGQLRNLDQKYQPRLEHLKRQKQFIQDILPFMRK